MSESITALIASALVALLLFGAAALLWQTTDDRARGAALTLVGAASAHLLREVHEILNHLLAK